MKLLPEDTTGSRGDPDARWASQTFAEWVLSSRFQPIVEISARRAIGYEGLLVATDSRGARVSPEAVFQRVSGRAAIHDLDLAARSLHLRNFAHLGGDCGRVFVNVSPAAAIEDLKDARAFPALMQGCGVEPASVVVEILEHGDADEALLAEAAAMYKALGCGVALDDVQAAAAAVERAWRLKPDMVKVDRAVVRAAALAESDLRTLERFVQALHALGVGVVLEGVENAREAAMAADVHADFAQGFHFAAPGRSRVDDSRLARALARSDRPAGASAGHPE